MACLKHVNALFLVLLPSTILSTESTLQRRFELVTALQKYFSSGCVVWQLLPEERHLLQTIQNIIQLQQFLSRAEVFSTVVDEERLNTTLPCRHNRPLYVLWCSGDSQKRHLRQLFSRLDPAGAVWLLLLDGPNAKVTDLFQSLHIPFDCEFLVAAGSQEAMELTEVYRVHQTFPLVTSHWGSWNYRDGLRPPHFRLVPRRNDLRGVTFSVAAIHDPPIQKLERIRRGELQVEGFTADVMRELSRKLNFRLRILQAEDNMYGIKHTDGTWDGSIGMVINGKVNMSMTIFTINEARYRDVGFTDPVSKTRVAVYVRREYKSVSSWKIYIFPFTGYLWLCVAVCIALSTLCLVAAQSWRREEYNASFSEMALSSWGMFCLQGFTVPFGPSSMRIVVWVSFLTAVVLIASYSARIISFLTLNEPKMPFNDLQGLLQEESYGFGMMKSIAALQNFREGVGVRRQLYERKLAPTLDELPLVNSLGFERVCKENYAFLCNDIFVDYNVIGCDVSFFYVANSYNPMAFILPKKSPYLRIINYTLRQLKRTGVVRRLRDMSRSRVHNQDLPTFDVDMHEVLALLLLCVLGVVMSLAVLLVEVFVNYRVRVRHSAVKYLHNNIKAKENTFLFVKIK